MTTKNKTEKELKVYVVDEPKTHKQDTKSGNFELQGNANARSISKSVGLVPAPSNGVIEELKKEIEILENKPYLDLTLICAKLNLSKKDRQLIENTFNLECLDNRLEGFNQGSLSKEKELTNYYENLLTKTINKWKVSLVDKEKEMLDNEIKYLKKLAVKLNLSKNNVLGYDDAVKRLLSLNERLQKLKGASND